MKVSVAICTWNRAALLEKALEAFEMMEVPSGIDWELIIVDNNSTDDTKEVVLSFKTRLPITYEFEACQGKSHALNRAVSVARGEYIAWTDDDAKVEKGWLSAYLSAFREWPDAVFFGGPVRAWLEEAPPKWLERVMPFVESAYALRDYGSEPFELTPRKVPYGVNMAVRTEEQRMFLYNPDLGPRPNSQLRGEETALVRSMMDRGYKGKWVPGAVVHHHVPTERQTTKYLRAFYRGQGEAQARRQSYDGARIFGKPRWAWKEAILGEIEYRIKRLIDEPEGWIHPLIRSSVAWGLLFGSTSVIR